MSDQQVKRYLDAAGLLVGSGYRDVARVVLDAVMGELGRDGESGESSEEGSAEADPILELKSPGGRGVCGSCGGRKYLNRYDDCQSCRRRQGRLVEWGVCVVEGCGSRISRVNKSGVCQGCREKGVLYRMRRGERNGTEERVCANCGKTFMRVMGRGKSWKYCGDECRKGGAAKRRAELSAEVKGRSEGKGGRDREQVRKDRRLERAWEQGYERGLNVEARQQAELERELAELGWEFSVSADSWVKRNGHKEAAYV